MACNPEDVISSTELSNLKLDIATIDDVVDSPLDTTTTKSGTVISTLEGQLKKLGYEVPVTYAAAISFTVNDNTKTVDQGGVIYAPLPSALPFTTTGTFVGGDDAKFFVIQGLTTLTGVTKTELAALQPSTLAEAVANTDLKVGDVITISDRGYGDFDVVLASGVTPNTYNVIQCVGVPSLALVLNVSDGALDARAMGAIGNNSFNCSPLVEAAQNITSILLFPSPNGEVYRFGYTPVLSGLTCIFSIETACSNRTINQVSGVTLGSGILGGHPQCEELHGKKIDIISGTIRQNAIDRTKWDYIKDANHEPSGVLNDGATQAIASGSEITINFKRTYKRVLSFVVGPDEDFANAAGMKVGASVGLSSAILKMSLDKHLCAYVEYTGAGTWGKTYGGGQGGTVNHNIEISSITHDDATGITTITHDALPGLDVSVAPYGGGATLAGGVPYIPVIQSVTNGYAAGSYQIRLKWLDLSTGNFVLVKNAGMACLVTKAFNSGVLVDGTFGTNDWDLDQGNIWFYGILER